MASPVSLNPFDYTPAELAKAGVAALTNAVALLGLAVGVFTDGPLAQVGLLAGAALVVLNPVLVFAKRAAPLFSGGEVEQPEPAVDPVDVDVDEPVESEDVAAQSLPRASYPL